MAYRIRKLVRYRLAAIVALTLVVAVAGGFVLALAAGAARTASAPSRYTKALDAPWDVVVEQQGGLARTEEVATLPSVARVAGATFVFAGLIAEGTDEPVSAIVFTGAHETFGTQVVAGDREDPADALGFTASRSFLAAAGPTARVGSRFTLIGIPRAVAEARGFDAADQAVVLGEATLVGVLDGATELQDGYAFAVFPTTMLDLGDIGLSGSQLVVELAPGATADDLRVDLDSLATALGGAIRFGIDPAEIVPEVVKDAATIRATGVAVLGAIVGIATIVVLGQILTRQVRAGDDQDLALRALGMTRAQRLAESVGLAAVPVAIGAALAGVAAWASSGWFPLGFVDRIEPHRGVRFDPLVHLLGPVVLGVAILAWVTVSLLLTRRGSRTVAPSYVLERFVGRIRRASVATGVRFAFSRVPGEPGTGRFALAGLAVVLAGLVAGTTFGASVGRLVDDPHRYGAHDMYLGQGGRELAEGTVDRIRDDDGIRDFGIGGTLLASVGRHALDVTAIETVKGNVDPYLFTGRLPIADDEIAIGKVTARTIDAGIGDRLTVSTPTGTVELTVTGIIVVPSIEGGDGIGKGGIVTVEAFERLSGDGVLNAALGNFRAGADRRAVMTGITTDLGIANTSRNGAFGGDPPGEIINLDRIRAIPYIVAAAFGVLALLALAHQLLVSGRRRRLDLAVLRAVGADGRWVTSAVHWQATALATAALLIGIPVGMVVGRLAYRAYTDRLGVVPGVTYGVAVLALAAAAVLVLANLVVATYTARRARRSSTAAVLTAG